MTPRRLRLDREFVPCVLEDGDESFANGIFEFNITRMWAALTSEPLRFWIQEIRVTDIPAITADGKDEATIARADLSRPGILAEISPGQFSLIDGHHRLARARREGQRTLRAYRVGPEHHTQFLISKFAYERYVEYWNGKCREWERDARRRA